MNTITLQFQTPQDLSGFRKMAGSKIVEVKIRELLLTCECSALDISQAMNYFGAKVIEPATK